jgi:hypothetical protein
MKTPPVGFCALVLLNLFGRFVVSPDSGSPRTEPGAGTVPVVVELFTSEG